MSQDDEWDDWQSCGTYESGAESVAASRRTGRSTRVGGGGSGPSAVMLRVETVVRDLECVTAQLATQSTDLMRWRAVTIVLLLLQAVQMLPAAARAAASALVERVLSFRSVLLLVVCHLAYTCARKMHATLRQRGMLGKAAAITCQADAAMNPLSSTPVPLQPPQPTQPPSTTAAPKAATPAAAAEPTEKFPQEALRRGIPNAELDAYVEAIRAKLPPFPTNDALPALSPVQRKVLDVALRDGTEGWDTLMTEDTGKWTGKDVAWNGGHACGKFEGVCAVPAEMFVKVMVDEAPRAQQTYDPLLETYTVMHDGGSHGGRVVYLSFHSPVSRFVVGQRDVLTFIERSTLTVAEMEWWGLTDLRATLREKHCAGEEMPGVAALGEDGEVSSRFEFETMPNAMVLATHSVEHEVCPPNASYTRARVCLQGYILLPLSPTKCYVIELVALDPKGSVPPFAVKVCITTHSHNTHHTPHTRHRRNTTTQQIATDAILKKVPSPENLLLFPSLPPALHPITAGSGRTARLGTALDKGVTFKQGHPRSCSGGGGREELPMTITTHPSPHTHAHHHTLTLSPPHATVQVFFFYATHHTTQAGAQKVYARFGKMIRHIEAEQKKRA